jgi:hypothetical protein
MYCVSWAVLTLSGIIVRDELARERLQEQVGQIGLIM